MRKTLAIVLIALGIVLIATSAIALVSFNFFISNVEQAFNLSQSFVSVSGINISIILYIGMIVGVVLLAAGIFLYRKSGATVTPNTTSQPPAQPPHQPTPETTPEMPAS
jgi:flagellar basal body-associated protein FliL